MQHTPTIEHIRNLPFFFILGRPRSGTTLMRTLLDAHPSVNIPLENSGMIHLYFKYSRVSRWDGKKLTELWNDFRDLNFIENWHLDWVCIKDIFDRVSGTQLSFHEVIKVFYFFYQSEFAKDQITCLGDKSPLNSLYSKELYRAFPQSKFIHLVRDYRANLASMSKHSVFSPSSTVILMQWKKSVRQIGKLATQHPESYLQIKYEELVSNPEDTCREICKFLNVRYIPEILDSEYRKNAVRNIYNSTFLNQWQPDLSGKITGSNINKWRGELGAGTIRKADYIAGEMGRQFNYEPESEGSGLTFILATELKKFLFHLNELNRYLYDRMPYKMKVRIKNRKFILSYWLIHYFQKRFEKN
jgi:hypothetical protein